MRTKSLAEHTTGVPNIAEQRTKSLPLMPLFFPAACRSSFAFFSDSSSAIFLSIRVRFHLANVSGVTGVRLVPSLWRYNSELSTIVRIVVRK